MQRAYLKVPFQEKDAAKSLGAKWDVQAVDKALQAALDEGGRAAADDSGQR